MCVFALFNVSLWLRVLVCMFFKYFPIYLYVCVSVRVGVCLWRHMCTGCCVSALPNSLPGLGKGESVS